MHAHLIDLMTFEGCKGLVLLLLARTMWVGAVLPAALYSCCTTSLYSCCVVTGPGWAAITELISSLAALVVVFGHSRRFMPKDTRSLG